MVGIFEQLHRAALAAPKRVLLPEASDPRVIDAARILAEKKLAIPVLISALADTSALPDTVEIFSARDDAAQWMDNAVAYYQEARAKYQPSDAEARKQLENPLTLAAVLLGLGYADCGVAGSIATTADVLRAGLQCLGLGAGSKRVSSYFLMELVDQRVLAFADCAVNPDPDSDTLADIAVNTAANFEKMTGLPAKVALLSFSTLGSADHPCVSKVRAAVEIARAAAPDLDLEGEIQFDAAFVPEIGAKKAPASAVAGQANVMIFPTLDAGNIGYKIAQRIGGAKAVGPILQGFAKPWMDLSRGCTVDEIVDTAVAASVMAQN